MPERLRVDILTAGAQWGGLEVHAAALARTLGARGHDVAIVELGTDAFTRRRDAREIGTRLVHMPLKGRGGARRSAQQVGLRQWHRVLGGLRGDVCVFTKGD